MPSTLELHKRRSLTPVLGAGIGIAVVLLLLIIRLVTLTPHAVRLHDTAATTIRLTGARPTPAWPTEGQAAFTVLGIGSVGSSGGNIPIPTASVAKVMTAYLILKHHPLSGNEQGFTITITAAQATAERQDAAQDQSVVPVAAGEQLTERQLLEALLIPSGDNIARALGAYDAGSTGAFVAEMNRTARALGMDHTTYTDPSGFEPTTVSTAADQLKLLERAIRSPVFREIVEMPSVTLPVAGTVTNYDPLIGEGYYGKTGSDSWAEGNLAFFRYVTVGGRRVTELGVVMGQGSGSDTDVILGAAGDAARDLAESVTRAITVHTVLPAAAPVMSAINAAGARVHGVTGGALQVIGWGGISERVTVSHAQVDTSLTKGQRLGTIALTGPLPTPRGAVHATAVRAASALAAPGLGWRISNIF